MIRKNKKIKDIIQIVSIIIAIGFWFWGSHIMNNYENYKLIHKAAAHEAMPQFLIAFGILVVGFLASFISITKTKK